MRFFYPSFAGFIAVAASVFLAAPQRADACGCLSPPEVTEGDYAVNQQAEQIIFEVGESTVTAHVLIRYEGDPAKFAWILPAPNVPALGLSETLAFGLLDQVSRPVLDVEEVDACPGPMYRCEQHPDPCDYGDTGGSGFIVQADAGAGTAGGGDGPPDGVDVLDMQVVGDYETVTFAAQDAALAVQWLKDNGFVVNDTMTPYMQPYIDAGMVFVAAKLVAGAGIDAIKPLKMTYQGTTPMIPLQLTAVAAEPHLTVTAYIYANGNYYRPIGHPLIEPDPDRLTADRNGRVNYPMLLARTIDEAGGDAFVLEYQFVPPGPPPAPWDDPSGCCNSPTDFCGLASDGQCQCPGQPFDAPDCSATPGLVEGAALIADLQQKYTHMTRLTTRLSPEEMTFDPTFGPVDNPVRPEGYRSIVGSRTVIDGCEADVLQPALAAYVDAVEDCAAVYCGAGTCVRTQDGVGCACNPGHAARVFRDLDGEPSVTCVPDTPPVILDKDVPLPDPCDTVSCGEGSCINLGGFPACACNGGAAAIPAGESLTPTCSMLEESSGSPGAEDFSRLRSDISICFAKPTEDCGPLGWYTPIPSDQLPANGVACGSSIPDLEDLVPPPKPETCGDGGDSTTTWTPPTTSGTAGSGTEGTFTAGSAGEPQASCACTARGTGRLPAAWAALGLGGLLARRRRRRNGGPGRPGALRDR